MGDQDNRHTEVIEGKPELTPVAIQVRHTSSVEFRSSVQLQAGKFLCRRLFAGATKIWPQFFKKIFARAHLCAAGRWTTPMLPPQSSRPLNMDAYLDRWLMYTWLRDSVVSLRFCDRLDIQRRMQWRSLERTRSRSEPIWIAPRISTKTTTIRSLWGVPLHRTAVGMEPQFRAKGVDGSRCVTQGTNP